MSAPIDGAGFAPDEPGYVPPDPDEPPDPGYVPPDPDEPPAIELWRAVGDVPPWGTMLLLLSWGSVFALLAWRHELGSSPAYLAHGASVTQRDALDASWRLLASTFLHAGPAHVVLNAATMLVFGPAVERIFTRWGFAIIFAGGGALASLASLAWRLSRYGVGPHISIGASGAIFALGGALLAGAFRLRGRLASGRARALGAAILFLALPALANGFEHHGTDNAAHAAGLVSGVLLGAVMPLSERLGGSGAPMPVRLLGALAVIALAISFVRVFTG